MLFRTPTAIVRSLGRLPSPAHPRERYELLRQRATALAEACREYSIARTVKYGRTCWTWPAKAQVRLQQLQDANTTADNAFFDYLCQISPRGDRWRSGIAAWWIVQHVTYDLAITRERLTVDPQPGYGSSQWHVDHVLEAVQE